MTHTYRVTGLTCGGCVATVTRVFSKISGVESIVVSADYQNAEIQMSRHVPLAEFQAALREHPKYQIAEAPPTTVFTKETADEPPENWLKTYQPVILIFAYLTGATLLVEYAAGSFEWMRWMRQRQA